MDGCDPPTRQIPFVEYLELTTPPRLVANECAQCGARYMDRRNACASCFTRDFRRVPLPSEGVIVSYTIIHLAAPGLPVPYVAAVVDCGGTWVRANLLNVNPDPEDIELGAKVQLTTFPYGTDATGTTAVGFGFEPVESRSATVGA
ncbi:hypothetical protein EEB14_45790 [Rhodococcus sp. WS4]|nr:hypothetical protein EEB14_45790 [Rhodococcus sp. WS4]